MDADDGEFFLRPGTISVSAEAIEYAKAFAASVSAKATGRYIVVFEWSLSVQERIAPGEPWRDLGACMTIGSYFRRHVPDRFVQVKDGLQFAVKMSDAIWQAAVEKRIVIDKTQPNGIGLI